MIKSRELKSTDDAVIAGIIRENLRKYQLDIPGTVYYDDGLDHLSEYYGRDKRRYFVLVDDRDRVIGGIGFAAFEPMEETAELQKLYLTESAKGEGLGYEMISLVEEEMRNAGFKYSYLETHDNLEAAIHVYERAGYTEIDRPAFVGHGAMNRFYKKAL